DFFAKVSFDYLKLMPFFLSFIHKQKLVLSIDRTEWDYGGCQVNVLCVIVSIGKMGVPLYFEMLDNNSGNSNSEDRIKLFKEIIELVGVRRIDYVVMDREFIGHKWLGWLRSMTIDFCVRVPKSHLITLPDGSWKAEDLIKQIEKRYQNGVWVNQVQVNVSLSYDEDGELLFLIGTRKATELRTLYKTRWGIEVVFQAFKGRGFRLEESCLRDIKKYKKLFALVAITYTLCWATGIMEGRSNPVKTKNHGYPQYSVFRRGLNLIRLFYREGTGSALFKVIAVAHEKWNQNFQP
ncbi:transposase, partial [uncultured Microscilla sp.]|uniref:transposase n=1 Tax=uncultured Microscilla sp. TaxID=432653 RepID=UPI0026163C9E